LSIFILYHHQDVLTLMFHNLYYIALHAQSAHVTNYDKTK